MRLVDISLMVLPLLAVGKTELDPATHRRLLLSGRPQVGLWKALQREAEDISQAKALQVTFVDAR